MRKKTEKNQNSATIMMSVDGKGTVFPVKLKLQSLIVESWNRLNKDIKKREF